MNESMESLENITVSVRIKPLFTDCHKNIINIINENGETPLVSISFDKFKFDNTFSDKIQQCDVYNTLLKPIISKVLTGYNCTIMAYGQTGSGKTYTMGTNPDNYKDNEPGIIPRVVEELFEIVAADSNLSLSISFIEIYQEKVYNLLSGTTKPLIVTGFEIKDPISVPVENEKQAFYSLESGSKNRHIRSTKMNVTSSRSHAIFTIYCTKKDTGKTSKLHLIDLAGSEGAKRTGNQGTPFKEGVTINKELFHLGRVMEALADSKSVNIPYRSSMLTRILHDSLNKSNYISLLVCVSSHEDDLSETMSTFRFAENAKLIKSKPKLADKEQSRYRRKFYTTVKKKPPRNDLFSSTLIKNHSSRILMSKNRNTLEYSPPFISPSSSLSVSSSTAIDSSHQQLNPNIISPLVRALAPELLNRFSQFMSENKENIINTAFKQKPNSLLSDRNSIENLTPENPPIISRRLDFDSPKNTLCDFKTTLRRSVRLSVKLDKSQQKRELDENIFEKCVNNSRPVLSSVNSRRSMRLSLKRCVNESNELFKIPRIPKQNKTIKEISENFSNGSNKRRQSARLSIMQINKNKSKLSSPLTRKTQNSIVETINKPRQKRLSQFKKISNEILSPLSKHKHTVLSDLNFGTITQLQKLQTVGPKTAQQIITHREIMGEFADFEALEKVPGWSKKKFDKFMRNNHLT